MADYRRNVVYMYQIENNTKIRNAGFVKLEARNGRCKIGVHMRGVHTMNEMCSIFLYQWKDREMEKVLLGEVKPQNGQIDFQKMLMFKQLSDAGIPLENLAGLCVVGGEHLFCGSFDGNDITAVPDLNELQDNGSNTELRAAEIEQKQEQKIEQTQEWEITEEEIEEKEEATKTNVQTSMEKLETQETEFKEAETEKNNQSVNMDAEAKVSQTDFKALSWDEWMERFGQVQPFSYGITGNFVKIEPKDLGGLSKEQWYLANNSFLLHGYYNYRYMILMNQEDSFYILVPGNYYHQERMMANMFGFQDFLPSQSQEKRNGAFGYWYRQIDIPKH